MTVRQRVEARAKGCCEYCRAPQVICGYTFHIEHIVPKSRGGPDELGNYALACFYCNLSKQAFTTGIDPKTKKEERLFHPRRDKWEDHFRWSAKLTRIDPRSAIGRATVARLALNREERREARGWWVETGSWP